MRRLFVFIGTLIVVALAFGGGALIWGAIELESPGPNAATRTILIDHGTGVKAIAARLESEGFIENAMVFHAAARWFASDESLKAGEYEIAAHSTPREILQKMVTGDVVQRRVTVPEGLTTAQIVALVRNAEALEGEIPEELAKLPQGELLPDTYQYTRGDTRESVLRRMMDAMDKAVAETWDKRNRDLPIDTPEEAVVLASIIEKETGVASERPRVAGVFLNRLEQGIPLQSDPTIIFALTDGKGPLGRGLTRADLELDSDYNTYTRGGLPPGPIANPGLASLQAAVAPMETKELYFVADGTGGHAFAETLAEHNKNVAKWRKLEAERAAEPEEAAPE